LHVRRHRIPAGCGRTIASYGTPCSGINGIRSASAYLSPGVMDAPDSQPRSFSEHMFRIPWCLRLLDVWPGVGGPAISEPLPGYTQQGLTCPPPGPGQRGACFRCSHLLLSRASQDRAAASTIADLAVGMPCPARSPLMIPDGPKPKPESESRPAGGNTPRGRVSGLRLRTSAHAAAGAQGPDRSRSDSLVGRPG
jgi:hypothetical protein